MTPLGQFLDPALVHRLNQLELSARSVVEGAAGGNRRSIRQGASVEFAQHRAFVNGDQPRRIDWRVLARTGKLFVREDQEETNARVLLALDCSGSMQYRRRFDSKLRYAQRIIAALAYLLLSKREAVGLSLFSESIDAWLPTSSSNTQLSDILDTLSRPLPTAKGPSTAMHSLASRLIRRSLIVIASDLFLSPAAFNEAMSRLRHRRHEIVVLRVLDPDERTFPFKSAVQFRGLEGEASLVRNASLSRRLYLDRFARHAAEIGKICTKHAVELHEFSTDIPLDEALVRFLTGRLR